MKSVNFTWKFNFSTALVQNFLGAKQCCKLCIKILFVIYQILMFSSLIICGKMGVKWCISKPINFKVFHVRNKTGVQRRHHLSLAIEAESTLFQRSWSFTFYSLGISLFPSSCNVGYEPAVEVISNIPLYSTHHTKNSPSLTASCMLWNKWTQNGNIILGSFFLL